MGYNINLQKNLQPPVTIDIVFGSDPNPLVIPYKSEQRITNNFFGLQAKDLSQHIYGKGFRCKFNRLSDGSFFSPGTSSSVRASFTEDNPDNFLFIARPTLTILVIHFILFIVGLFGFVKVVESMVDFIKGKHDRTQYLG